MSLSLCLMWSCPFPCVDDGWSGYSDHLDVSHCSPITIITIALGEVADGDDDHFDDGGDEKEYNDDEKDDDHDNDNDENSNERRWSLLVIIKYCMMAMVRMTILDDENDEIFHPPIPWTRSLQSLPDFAPWIWP